MILWRYLSREFLKFTGLIVFSFLSIFVVVDFFDQNSRYFPKYNATGPVIAEYYVTLLPKLFSDVLPFGVLLGSMLTYWVFARSGEIAAMRAAGSSVLKLSSPLIFWGLAMTGLSFLISETVVPKSSLRHSYVEDVKIKKIPEDMIFQESNWVRGDNSVLYFNKLDQVHQALDEPEFFLFGGSGFVREVAHARKAYFDPKTEMWRLDSAVVTNFDSTGKTIKVQLRPYYFTNVFSQPPRLLKEGVTSDQVSYRELRDLISQSKQAGGAITGREVELEQKLSLPFANLIFVFVTMRFAIRKERQADTYMGIALILLIAILYHVGNALMRNLAQNGWMTALAAAWLTNIAFAIGSFFVVRDLDKGM